MCADTSKRKGLASFVEVKCTPCGYSMIQKEGKGVKAFDVNTRSAYAMRSCGLGTGKIFRINELITAYY